MTNKIKILTINIDSKIPNLALHKIEKYHIDQGHEVIRDVPFERHSCDKVYVSCIFVKNKILCNEWEGIADIGGTGYDLHKKLPEDIEKIKPKINWGFTTRGCIRKCPFCFVPEKEGKIHRVGDIYDIWDGRSKNIVIMDNNILAIPEHFKLICKQIQKENLRVDFNQGLDIRLLTDELASVIKKTKMGTVRFAFDAPSMYPIVKEKMRILHDHKINAMWYVLTGFNSTIDEEVARINYLVANNQRPYLMRHANSKDDRRYTALSAWVNNPKFGKGTMPLNDFLTKTEYSLTNGYAKLFGLKATVDIGRTLFDE